MKRYFWNLLIAIDQLGNALAAGSPDETISSRAGSCIGLTAITAQSPLRRMRVTTRP